MSFFQNNPDSFESQSFFLPLSTIHQLFKSLKNPDAYKKLIKCCQYFYAKYPMLILSCLHHVGGNRIPCYTCIKKKCTKDVVSHHLCHAITPRKPNTRFWISEGLYCNVGNGPEETNTCSSLFPKLANFNIKELCLYNQTFLFEELQNFGPYVEVVNLSYNKIYHYDGTVAKVEQVVGMFSNVKKMTFAFLYNFTRYTEQTLLSDSIAKMVKLENMKNFEEFQLDCILPSLFDFDTFADFMMKSKFPVSVHCKIPESLIHKRKNSITCAFSQSQKIPGTNVQFIVRFYPNGNSVENIGKVLLFVQVNFRKQKQMEAEFSIAIESANFFETPKEVFEPYVAHGMQICESKELCYGGSRFIKDGKMEIKIDGFLMIEKNAIVASNKGIPKKIGFNSKSHDSLRSDVMRLWNQMEFKKVTLIAEEKEVKAHDLILINCSPIFEAILKHDQTAEITIPDFPFGIVEIAIKLCYDTSLVSDVSLDNQILLLRFFDKYDIHKLKNKFEAEMITVINGDNVQHLANCAIVANAPKLGIKCDEFIQNQM